MAVPTSRPWRHVFVKALALLALAFVCFWWRMLLLGPERHLSAASLQYVPFWLVLLPLGVIAAYAWRYGWLWRTVTIAALLIFLGPVMGFNIGRPEPGPDTLRVMTYNIKAHHVEPEDGWGGFEDIATEIRRHDPDIVVMQDARIPYWARIADPDAVRELLAGARTSFALGEYIVASRLPMRDCEAGSIAFDDRPRWFVHCIVTVGERDIDVYTAHLLSPREGLNAIRWDGIEGREEWRANAKDRLTQSDMLARAVAGRSRPAIVAGDLNAPESSLVIRHLLATGLRDAFSAAGTGYGYTHGHSQRPYLFSTTRIDHILVSPEFAVADSFVGGRGGSQHRPVIADIRLR